MLGTWVIFTQMDYCIQCFLPPTLGCLIQQVALCPVPHPRVFFTVPSAQRTAIHQYGRSVIGQCPSLPSKHKTLLTRGFSCFPNTREKADESNITDAFLLETLHFLYCWGKRDLYCLICETANIFYEQGKVKMCFSQD